MSEAILSSSPTKTLSTWWKSFKQKEGEDDASQSLQRPGLNRPSLSSSAVPRLSDARGDAAAKTHGVDIPPQYVESPIFGTPLAVSLTYASVKISLTDTEGTSFVYGHVPIIVAKCAVFLKQSARETEGIFRLPGSVRRIKVLQELFNTPPSFGRDLEWQGFTVHDAANLLKRYLTQLPESIIPRRYYDLFRKPLQTRFAGIRDYMNYHAVTGPSSPSTQTDPAVPPPPEPSPEDINAAIAAYEDLIFKLPPASLQLLAYLLDLLSMFAAQSNTNRMPAYNLAAIFQPSILALPEHQMNPDEYQTSRLVIEFLINHSLSILQQVETRAIKDHARKKSQGDAPLADNDTSKPPTPTQDNDEGDIGSHVFALPQFNFQPPESGASHDQIPTPRSSTDETTAATRTDPQPLAGSVHNNNNNNNTSQLQQPRHGRQHSKSLSSAHPPSIQEPNKLPGFLRRQRSHRYDSSDDGDGADDPPTRYGTRSPPIEEEADRKSRFRRSLMVLLPNRDDHQASRNTSPQTGSKPELNRSPSWFARLSSNNNNASRSASPDE